MWPSIHFEFETLGLTTCVERILKELFIYNSYKFIKKPKYGSLING